MRNTELFQLPDQWEAHWIPPNTPYPDEPSEIQTEGWRVHHGNDDTVPYEDDLRGHYVLRIAPVRDGEGNNITGSFARGLAGALVAWSRAESSSVTAQLDETCREIGRWMFPASTPGGVWRTSYITRDALGPDAPREMSDPGWWIFGGHHRTSGEPVVAIHVATAYVNQYYDCSAPLARTVTRALFEITRHRCPDGTALDDCDACATTPGEECLFHQGQRYGEQTVVTTIRALLDDPNLSNDVLALIRARAGGGVR